MSSTVSVSVDQIKSFRESFANDPHAKIGQNCLHRTSIKDLTVNQSVLQSTDVNVFSHKLDGWGVTNQKKSGRCWLFAMLNLLKRDTAKKLNIKEFEFSQSFIQFYDKLERSNHFLEAMIETSDVDIDRTIDYLLKIPIGDGGQWSMAVNIINKHGLVPASIYPESDSSGGTLAMNNVLKDVLRTAACELRRQRQHDNASLDTLREYKAQKMANIWKILAMHLGTPPETFSWNYLDSKSEHQQLPEMTPLSFVEEYVDPAFKSYVCLVNDPRNDYLQTYTVDYLQSVVGAPAVIYLNLPAEDIKRITQRQIEDGRAVWMGCDVGKQCDRSTGIWDQNMYEMQAFYGVTYGMDKASRLKYHQTLMTHAMLFTGVDLGADGSPRKWRVENSWGESSGKKGFYTMNDNWFDEHMFEIAAPASYLTEEMTAALEKSPVMLPAWDPMGSLALEEGW